MLLQPDYCLSSGISLGGRGGGSDSRYAKISARSESDSICSRNGGISPLELRTNALKASKGSLVLASTLPPLVATEPWPSKPWHCQQPFLTNATLPFSADAAVAGALASRLAAMTASPIRTQPDI